MCRSSSLNEWLVMLSSTISCLQNIRGCNQSRNTWLCQCLLSYMYIMINGLYCNQYQNYQNCPFPRMPCPDGKRQFGTAASNSWSKRETLFLLKKDVRLTMNIACVALGSRIWSKHSNCLSPIGCGGLGRRLFLVVQVWMKSCDYHMVYGNVLTVICTDLLLPTIIK